MTIDQDHGQRNDATVWKYETQWPSMTVVYAKQLPAVDIGAGPISEEGNPGKANGHSSLHTQSQHNSSSLNFNLLSSLPVNTANFQVSLRKKKRSKLQSSQKQENNKIETWYLGGVPLQPHLWCYFIYSKLTPSRSWKSKFLQRLRCHLLLDFFFVFSWFLCSKRTSCLTFIAKFEKELQVGQQDIVLDCNYHFDSHEAEQLEVKWYFNKVLTIFALFAPWWARAIKIKNPL